MRNMIGTCGQSDAPARPADLQAVGIRQHDVQDEQVRLFAAAQVERALAGLRSHQRVTFALQVVLQEREQIRVIFNQ